MKTETETEKIVIKTIAFDIPKDQQEIKISSFLDEGFDRKYVVALFEKLQIMGFGKYFAGKKGRGHSTKFIPAENCPKVYILEVIQKKRGRKKSK